MVSYVINPITKRRIKATGRTARLPAVSARLQGYTARGTKETKCGRFELCVGSKLQVWNGTARQTPGGVTKAGLYKDRYNHVRFVSRSIAAKKNPEFMQQAALVAARYAK